MSAIMPRLFAMEQYRDALDRQLTAPWDGATDTAVSECVKAVRMLARALLAEKVDPAPVYETTSRTPTSDEIRHSGHVRRDPMCLFCVLGAGDPA